MTAQTGVTILLWSFSLTVHFHLQNSSLLDELCVVVFLFAQLCVIFMSAVYKILKYCLLSILSDLHLTCTRFILLLFYLLFILFYKISQILVKYQSSQMSVQFNRLCFQHWAIPSTNTHYGFVVKFKFFFFLSECYTLPQWQAWSFSYVCDLWIDFQSLQAKLKDVKRALLTGTDLGSALAGY